MWIMITSSNGETFPVLLALYEGNASVTDGFPSQSQVTRSFDVFFDLRLNKRQTIGALVIWDVITLITTSL